MSFFNKWKMAHFGLLILATIVIIALLGPIISSYSYEETSLVEKNLPPSFTHFFGTDDLGRDLFVRNCYGARISLTIGIAAASIDMIIGVIFGSVAGYFGGKIDEVMMRFADILYSLPYLLIVTLLLVIMEPGITSMILALAVIGWITMARIVRTQVMQVKQQEFVKAAKAFGASSWWVLRKHLIPHSYTPILSTLTLTIPTAIFAEAFLSFLGLGIQAPMASLGTMTSEGLPALQYYPWRALFPICTITLIMLGFNCVGEAFSKKQMGVA